MVDKKKRGGQWKRPRTKRPAGEAKTEAPAASPKLDGTVDDSGSGQPPVLPPRLPSPVKPVTVSAIVTRDVLCEAVFVECCRRGSSTRDARDMAEDTADRLRLEGRDADAARSFYDLRHEQDYLYPRGKNKARTYGSTVVMRDPSTIDTICTHQAASEFGVSKRSIARSGGDVELARARRALDVACHAMTFRQGYFVAAHPLRAYVNHGNRFNATSLGVEIDGHYPGLADRSLPNGDQPTILTEQTVRAACAMLRWLVEEARSEGMPISKVVAHRSSNDQRRGDPGEEIWKRIVLDFAVSELGLTAVCRSPWSGRGRHVPLEWDADNGIGSY